MAIDQLTALASLPTDPRGLAGFLPGIQPPVRMRLRWNPGVNADRGAWLADFYDDARTLRLAGVRVVVEDDMWAQHRVGTDLFPRKLRVRLAAGAPSADPLLRDLGGGVQMEVADLDE